MPINSNMFLITEDVQILLQTSEKSLKTICEGFFPNKGTLSRPASNNEFL